MRWMIPLLLCALAPSLSLASADTDGDGLTDEWERGLGRYQVIEGAFTWEQAKADAEARGGKLATVTSESEWTAATTYAGPLTSTATLWLGGRRPAGAAGGVAQSWQWVSGEKWNYTRWWFAGEPNSPNYQTADCYLTVNWPNQNPKGSWNDTDAVLGNTFGYLLEFGYPTDPLKADSDGDGYDDKVESDFGTDPNDATVFPPDTMPPVITLNGANPQTVYRGTTFTDLGATVTDDFDATRTITGSGTVDTSTVGSYTLTYTTQDAYGNLATPVTRTVNVVLNPTGDEDNDGLNNTEEANLGTNPYDRDTDGDGVNDLREVQDGTDPLDAASFHPLSKGLVALYKFDGTLVDTINVYSSAVARNEVFFVEDERFGQVVKMVGQGFNGSSGGHIELPEPALTNKGSYAVSFWMKEQGFSWQHGEAYITAGFAGSSRALLGHYGDDSRPPNAFYTDNTLVSLSQNLGAGFVGTSGITDVWNHYAISESNGVASVFRNGIKLYDAPVSGEPQGNWHMGRHWWDGGFTESTRLIGSVANLRIYDRTLTASEVSQLLANDIYEGYGLEGVATKSPFDPATAVNWGAGGTEWTVDTAVSHDGVDSVKAQTTDSQSTYREYTVTGPAVVDFWWKVSSEELYDTFSYSVNGVNQQTISGEVDWTYRTLTLPAGTHTIRWTYTKDASDAVGQDAGWVDEFIVYPAEATLRVSDGATTLTGTTTVDFGSVDLQSASSSKTLTFANDGYVPLELLISLPEGSPFSFEEGSSYELLLGRGESVEVPIFLSTDSAGTKTAQLSISAPDSVVAPPTLTLQGVLLGQKIAVAQGGNSLTSGQSLDMGLAPRALQFTISNTGNVGNLEIAAISSTGNFQITQQPQATIAAQGSTTFTVVAQATAFGNQAGGVTITCNDPDTPTFTIPLTAKSFAIGGEGIRSDSMATSGTGGAVGWDLGTTQLPSGQVGQAVKTGTTPNNGGSVLEFTAQTAGVVSWSWKVGSQENFDWLLCEVDGQEVAGISTKNGVWQTQVVNVPAGANVRWVYRKDASASAGEDAGYLADVEFRSFAANQSFSQWAQTHDVTDPQQRLPKSGVQTMFAWLGGIDPEIGPDAGHHKPIIEGRRLKYHFPISKTADGTQQILYSSDMSAWTTRRFTQRVVSEDADRVVVEATAPSGTKGFFKVVGNGDTSMVWVDGGILPPELGGFAVATFEIGKTEVTWAEWQMVRDWAVANGYTDLAGVGGGSGPAHPVHGVSWYDVVKWCNAKSEMEGRAPVYSVGGATFRTGFVEPTNNPLANGYRLPTEAEWEWAAIGGIRSQGYIYSGGDDIEAVAWYDGNSLGAVDELHNGLGSWPVAEKLANELGIYDMSGNVWEWCEDLAWGTRRFRGGSFVHPDFISAITFYGFSGYPDDRSVDFGLRLARNAD